ncbi:hypothetical protein HMPREF1555_01279 [Porphyromonas gingivalis F0570]|uniref:Uncharacterized protein n=1 Tax=Porphyromonas gingivalis F0570 TaxID=1227271 RepID=A0A0E2LQF3_PORGN|nr:hypothetical protein HMPREF1555_01279 [Porphyromonas gingivalis F0570]
MFAAGTVIPRYCAGSTFFRRWLSFDRAKNVNFATVKIMTTNRTFQP